MRMFAIGLFACGLALGGAEAAPLENCVKAEAAYQAGDLGLEVAYYTRCIEEDRPRGQKLAIALNNRGVAHHALGDPDAAIGDFDQALSLDPAYAMAQANRGLAYVAKGEFVQAMLDYDKAIELDPAYAPAYANRCWLFGYMGYGESALADCDESLRLDPDDADTLDSRAFAYWIIEDREQSRRDLVLARRLDPARPTWQQRFAEFETMFSVGYPYSVASIQSADSQEEPDEHEDAPSPVVLQANPH